MDLRALIAVIIIVILSWSLATNDACASEADRDQADFWYYTSQGVLVADWLTTRHCADVEGCYENNQLLAKVINNSDGTINKTKLDILSIAAIIGNHYVQDIMSTKQRILFNSGHTMIRFYIVGGNISAGMKIRF